MTGSTVRRAIVIVALCNLAYFFIEGTVALRIGSASLLADSADFFEDATVNFLILMALGMECAGAPQGWLPAGSGPAAACDSVSGDPVEQGVASTPTRCLRPVDHRAGCARRQSWLCAAPGPGAACSRQPYARSVSVGAQ